SRINRRLRLVVRPEQASEQNDERGQRAKFHRSTWGHGDLRRYVYIVAARPVRCNTGRRLQVARPGKDHARDVVGDGQKRQGGKAGGRLVVLVEGGGPA